MTAEHARLSKLFNEKKISQAEFDDLVRSLPKDAESRMSLGRLVINPFVVVSSTQALVVGGLFVLVSSAIAFPFAIYFPGFLDLRLVGPLHDELTLAVFLKKSLGFPLFSLVGAACIAFLICKISGTRNLRLLDFVGLFFLSRYPYFLATLALIVVLNFYPEIKLNPEKITEYPAALALVSLISIPSLVWQIVAYFLAFKAASGLANTRLWVSFIGMVTVSEALSLFLVGQIV